MNMTAIISSSDRMPPSAMRSRNGLVTMMAIIDRLLHHGEVFYVRGSSYRMRGKEPVTLNTKGDGFLAAEKV